MKRFNPYTLALPIIIFAAGYLIAYDKDNYPAPQQQEQNYYGKKYVNGEILLPDYAITDTLIVVNADLLNEIMPLNAGSDDAISISLEEGTETFADYTATANK